MARQNSADAYLRDAEDGHAEIVLPSPLTRSSTMCSLDSTASTLVGEIIEKDKLEIVKPERLAAPVTKPALKASKWVRFNLWFNTYRKFWLLVITLNAVGILCAALGRFKYAEDHLGALVLGNLLAAILVRNEIFSRFLFLFVNALFAEARVSH